MTIQVVRPLGWVELRLSAAGPVPPGVAWERYESLDRWPTWSPQLSRVDATPRRLRDGLAGRVVGPAGITAGFVVTEVDVAARRWSWTVKRWPITVELEHGVDADDDVAGGSRTWLVLRGPAPLVLGYAPVAWYALHRLVTLPVEADPAD